MFCPLPLCDKYMKILHWLFQDLPGIVPRHASRDAITLCALQCVHRAFIMDFAMCYSYCDKLPQFLAILYDTVTELVPFKLEIPPMSRGRVCWNEDEAPSLTVPP